MTACAFWFNYEGRKFPAMFYVFAGDHVPTLPIEMLPAFRWVEECEDDGQDCIQFRDSC